MVKHKIKYEFCSICIHQMKVVFRGL
uniref:Uncharacterized protein n=1 Tax=Anguilla anguilla TaxID=7936 RepID=A0A0E9PYQ2_ANGAN